MHHRSYRQSAVHRGHAEEHSLKRIVVIEDNAGIRQEIVDVLGLEGFEVREAGNGRLGIDIIREWNPDLVICDVMMPELDGFGTLAAVRGDERIATVPFLLLTARAERQDIRRGMQLGADDYLTKPFTLDELLAAVVAALAKRERAERATEMRLGSMRDQIADALPHELRTPLACIMGYAEMLADAASRSTVDVTEAAKKILGAGLRMNRIAENSLLYMQLELLRQGRGDTGVLALGGRTQLHETVEEAAREIARSHHRGDDLVLDLEPAAVCMGKSYAGKVASELLDNAFKFSPPRTPVTITIRRGDPVLLHVTDRGCGMDPTQTASIGAFIQFERFSREQQGLGLGLSIAYRIAVLWGGELRIDSVPRQGTSIVVSFRASAPGRPSADSNPPQADPDPTPPARDRA